MNGEVVFKEKLVKHNIKTNVINGVFAVIAANLVTPYFAKFAERLGAGDYGIGMLSSLPAAICIFTLIPGAILIESFKNKKNITGALIFTHKLFYLLLAAVPFVPKSYQAWLFIFLVGLMNLPVQWVEWDISPALEIFLILKILVKPWQAEICIPLQWEYSLLYYLLS